MTDTNAIRPELLLGANPFLEALPPPVPFKQIPGRLAHKPLVAVDWQKLDAADREPLLEFSTEHFAATAALLEAVAGVQTLIRRALLMRNPLSRAEHQRMNRVGLLEEKGQFRRIQQLDGAGLLLTGMTGTGKSALLLRALSMVAPDQVIDWGTSKACEWYSLRQAVYLKVDFASNGSRGGLLKRILETLDETLGTDYLDDHKRTTNIDTLIVTVCKLLSRHRVALLVIDEKQQSTFEDNPWRIEFVLFYLTLMNLGISVALAGNPLAFEHLYVFSQVMRRFSAGGIHHLEPAESVTTPWWARDFVPTAREFNLVEHWDVPIDERNKLEFDSSGGLPGLYMPYHVEVQREALRRGGASASVTRRDYDQALKSRRFQHIKDIAVSINSPTLGSTGTYLDIPAAREPSKGGKASGTGKPVLPVVPSEQAVVLVKRLLARYTADQTKKTNQLTKQLEVLKSLSPDDIRALGVTQDHMKEFESMLESRRQGSPAKRGQKPASEEQPPT
ncbi:MAG: ATP-binding protein [Alphaproteobacteria bacterium]|nr:MAG: ATP-binding protein [Alphaproteobacteria bacterium]